MIRNEKQLGQNVGTIAFESDRIRVTGPKVDGGYTVSFEVGEYEQLKIAALLTLPSNETKTVEVTTQ